MEKRRCSESDAVVRKSTTKCTPSTWHADRRSRDAANRARLPASHWSRRRHCNRAEANEIELPNVFRRKIYRKVPVRHSACSFSRLRPVRRPPNSGSPVPPAPLPLHRRTQTTDQATPSPVRRPRAGTGRRAARRWRAEATEDWTPTGGDVPTRHPICNPKISSCSKRWIVPGDSPSSTASTIHTASWPRHTDNRPSTSGAISAVIPCGSPRRSRAPTTASPKPSSAMSGLPSPTTSAVDPAAAEAQGSTRTTWTEHEMHGS